jgi:ribokinase
MMNKILVVGSINLDYVFKVDEMVRKGETIHSHRMDQFLGGKGFNQAIALRRAYPEVHLAVNFFKQDEYLMDAAKELGLGIEHMRAVDVPTGMAFIQVNQEGDNCIVINSGANAVFTKERFEEILKEFGSGDLLVLQNEINELPLLIQLAKQKGLAVALNPSPFNQNILTLPLKDLDYLIVNEIEGNQLTHATDPKEILDKLQTLLPNTCTVLTLGSDGVMAQDHGQTVQLKSRKVKAVDTTAAGDTFLGFFLGARVSGKDLRSSLDLANHAAALCVTREGASNSIPSLEEVEVFIQESA